MNHSGIIGNIELTQALIDRGDVPQLIGTVCGSESAQAFWQEELNRVGRQLGIAKQSSLIEDLPVNQAFGLLLMWQRLRPQLEPNENALMAFVFGEGTRASPWTEAELGQKPALWSTAPRGEDGRRPSVVSMALQTFLPVEAFLRRSGFNGVLVKWGDEIQIPSRDLSGIDPRFRQADIVRFVSLQDMDEDSAANKDWVGVTANGSVTAFIPRRPLGQMLALADRGIFQRDENGTLRGGVNLGSIALSKPILSLLLEEFSTEVNDPKADRKERPDLDPQLFTALCIAALPESERASSWETSLAESDAMRSLSQNLPHVLDRLVLVLARFEKQEGRPLSIQALDFEQQYWGDIGQHPKIYEFYSALREDSPRGQIARALAQLPQQLDKNGNLLVNSEIGRTQVTGSVLIDASLEDGTVHNSVLVGTKTKQISCSEAFDIESIAPAFTLAARSGCYRVISSAEVNLEAGLRRTSVPLEDGMVDLEILEQSNLRDRRQTYDVALPPNTLSFKEANQRVKSKPSQVLEAVRSTHRDQVEAMVKSAGKR